MRARASRASWIIVLIVAVVFSATDAGVKAATLQEENLIAALIAADDITDQLTLVQAELLDAVVYTDGVASNLNTPCLPTPTPSPCGITVGVAVPITLFGLGAQSPSWATNAPTGNALFSPDTSDPRFVNFVALHCHVDRE